MARGVAMAALVARRVALAALVPALLSALAVPLAAQEDVCLECHGSRTGMEGLVDELRPSLLVESQPFSRSVHGAFSCSDCHLGYEQVPHDAGGAALACSDCHDDAAAALASSVHGQPSASGPVACTACHGTHDILPPGDRDSRLHPLEVHRVCGSCHFDIDPVTATVDELLTEPYTDDSHARGIFQAGLVVTATCVSCHGSHSIHSEGDPESPLAPGVVHETCARCHLGVADQYRRSVHHRTPPTDGRRAATCIDCHQPHEMVSPADGALRVGMVETCGACHTEQAETFRDTFHGKLTGLGGERAAKCQDCHGTHEILPPSDPASPLFAGNIVATCGRCHPGSHAGFADYLPHARHDDPLRWPLLTWAYRAMNTLLVGTMAVALLHTLLFLVRLLLERKEWRAHKLAARAAAAAGGVKLYRRFDRGQRTLHLLMVISFLTLAATGMTLKFAHAPWARTLAAAMGGIEQAGTLHRIAALLLLGVFAWHLRAVVRLKRRRRCTWLQLIAGKDSIVFNRRDLPELAATLRWFVGRGKRPRFGRYTYWEKFDYFAVFWGIAVIGVTGLMLWFPTLVTWVVPGIGLNLAAIVHGDEALLAVAFIFTVHFFNTQLRPDKFPMDPVIFTGRMTVEELAWERPAEYEDLVATGRLQEHLVDPLPPEAERGFRLFAALALLTGLTLVVLIVWALAMH